MQASSSSPFDQVVVHPLVLLSIVDHYNRVARDTRKRVVGVLLGEKSKGRLDVTNSFAGAPPTARIEFALRLALRAGACCIYCMMPTDSWFVYLQSLLKRMSGMPKSGFWTTAIWRPCMACSGRSMVSILIHSLFSSVFNQPEENS